MELLLLTADPTPASVLPAVDLLPVRVRSAAPEAASLVTSGPYDLVLLDARHDLAAARTLCRLLGTDGLAVSILAIVTEGGMVAIGPEWGVSDVVLATAGPAEVHARLRLLAARTSHSANSGLISLGDLTIEEDTYTARLRGRAAGAHLQGVRAAQVPRPAPGPGLHPGAAGHRGVGLRLLRRHPNRRRACPAAAGQARSRARGTDRDRPQRRLQDGAAGPDPPLRDESAGAPVVNAGRRDAIGHRRLVAGRVRDDVPRSREIGRPRRRRRRRRADLRPRARRGRAPGRATCPLPGAAAAAGRRRGRAPARDPAEVAVDPAAGGRAGHRAARGPRSTGRAPVWAHGDLPAARRSPPGSDLRRDPGVAADAPDRCRSTAVAVAELAAGVRIRTFVPGQDEAAFLGSTPGPSPGTRSRAGWTWPGCAPRWPRTGSTRRASSSPSPITATSCSASTGPRCIPTEPGPDGGPPGDRRGLRAGRRPGRRCPRAGQPLARGGSGHLARAWAGHRDALRRGDNDRAVRLYERSGFTVATCATWSTARPPDLTARQRARCMRTHGCAAGRLPPTATPCGSPAVHLPWGLRSTGRLPSECDPARSAPLAAGSDADERANPTEELA